MLGWIAFVLTSPVAASDTVLVSPGSTWRYLDTGVDPGPGFADPAFDDAAWAQGPAQLGYGDGDEATVVSFGPDPNRKHVTTWFRRAFVVVEAARWPDLVVRVLRDDGVVVYLNGAELLRDGMPAGPLGAETLADLTVSGPAEDEFVEFLVPATQLVDGTNVLAVEIHQADVASSDISFDLGLVGRNDWPAVIRGPYLNQAAPDAMVVRWRTEVPTATRVWWGPAPDALDHSREDPVTTLDHEVHIDGLTPATTWYYGVGTDARVLAGADGDHHFRTSPAVGSRGPFRTWVVGDSGTADAGARAVREAFLDYTAGVSPDLFLMLGDNAYYRGTDAEYQRALFDVYPTVLRTTPLFPTLGNHDALSADSDTLTGVYYDIFTLPRAGESGGTPSGTEAYYSFDFGNAHFICLDSEDTDRMPGSPMLTWLEQDLIDTDQDWVIAFWHHPPYSKGSHDSDTEGRLMQMRGIVLPVLEDHGVDLVLAGHSHSYERTFLLDGHYGDSLTFDPALHVVDGGDGQENGTGPYRKPTYGPAPHEGAVYVVAGSSGTVEDGPLDHPAMFVSMSRLGSMVLDVAGYRLDARFLDDQGAVADHFTLLKGQPVLTGPVPGQAGGDNTFTLTGGVPGAAAHLVLGLRPGATPVPGCPRVSLDFVPEKVWAMGPTDGAGRAELTVAVPRAARGRTATFQVVQLDGCVTSPPVVWAFP